MVKKNILGISHTCFLFATYTYKKCMNDNDSGN